MASAARPPTGATKVVGGISFDDPFDWLHPDTAESLDWQDRRSAAARDHARSIVGFEQLRLTIEKIMRGTSALAVLPLAPRRRGGRWFRLASDLSSISVAGGLDDPGRVVVDASRLSAVYGEPARLWFPFEPSPDGRKLLVGVSRGGAMIGDVRVLDVDSGHLFDLTVDAELANQPLPGWFPDNDRFLIAERGADQRHQIRSCEVSSGTSEIVHMIPDGDVPAGSPALSLQVSPGGRFAVAVTGPHEHTAVQIGDLATGRWRRLLPDEWQGECYGTWLDEDIYLAIVADISPRGRLVAIPAATSSDTRTWTELVAPSDAVLKTITIVDDTIVLAEILDVAANLRLFNRFGVPKGPVRLPAQGSTNLEFPPRILPDNDAFTFAFSTFNQPPTIYQLEPHTAQLQAIGAAPHPLEHVEFSRHFVPSCDGTRIPYFVVRRADLGMSEPHPTLIHAYGGFNVALLPTFLGGLVPFVDAGGIYVHACPRGGAEWQGMGRWRAPAH
jgi:prolyl oligopeptidase